MGFNRTNSLNAIGGPARVLISPTTYPHPTKIDDIVDLAGATYAPQVSTYGWIDIGMTDTPSRLTNQVSSTQWRSEQNGQFRTSPMDWLVVIAIEAIEITQQNKVNLLWGSATADPATGQSRTNFPALIALPYYHMAFVVLDQAGRVHAAYVPKAQWDGSAIAMEMARGNMQKIPLTMHGFPDDTLVDAATGQAIFRADFDQH